MAFSGEKAIEAPQHLQISLGLLMGKSLCCVCRGAAMFRQGEQIMQDQRMPTIVRMKLNRDGDLNLAAKDLRVSRSKPKDAVVGANKDVVDTR